MRDVKLALKFNHFDTSFIRVIPNRKVFIGLNYDNKFELLKYDHVSNTTKVVFYNQGRYVDAILFINNQLVLIPKYNHDVIIIDIYTEKMYSVKMNLVSSEITQGLLLNNGYLMMLSNTPYEFILLDKNFNLRLVHTNRSGKQSKYTLLSDGSMICIRDDGYIYRMYLGIVQKAFDKNYILSPINNN
jgi:hypothetical protein